MSEEEDIAALVIDNGSGMCKGMYMHWNCNDCFDHGGLFDR